MCTLVTGNECICELNKDVKSVDKLNCIFLRRVGVSIHEREHLNDETFVVHRVMKPGRAIDRHHGGQVAVVMVGTPAHQQETIIN